MDIYSTRAQLAAIELMPREFGVLDDLFGKDGGTVEDEKAIFDVKKGSTPMAPTVKPGAGGVLMTPRDGYETNEIEFACIAPERIIEDENLKGRMFNERVLGAMTPEQREKKILAQDLQDMQAAIVRREEWMIRQVILEGKLEIFTYTNEGRNKKANLLADFNFTNNYAPTTEWDQSGADIQYDMEKLYDLVYAGMGTPEIILMAHDVWTAMRNNEAFMKNMDRDHVRMNEINQKYRDKGIRYLGVNQDGVEMYASSGTFTDDDGTKKLTIPSGKLIIGGRGMIKKLYGPVTQVEESGPNARHKTYIKKLVPLRYGSIESNAIKNRLTSCPVMMPVNVDGWAVGTML